MASAPTSPLPLTIPQEIKDVIVQHLSAYPSALASCALAHRSLTSTSQTLLFRDVLLSGADRTNAFRESITSSHYLASLVTQLVIAELDGPASRLHAPRLAREVSAEGRGGEKHAWVADAVPQLLAVLEALPNLTALAMRCGAPGSSEWAVGPGAGEAPAGSSVLLAQCANRLRALELDLYFTCWSTDIRSYSFPVLHTLIFSHKAWYESSVQDWLTVAPAIRRIVLWVMNGGKALRRLQMTEQGLVPAEPIWMDGEVMGGDWWLRAEIMEEGRNLKRIEMVVYQEEESGDGARDDVKTDPLGVYKCKDGRKVEVVTVRIPKTGAEG